MLTAALIFGRVTGRQVCRIGAAHPRPLDGPDVQWPFGLLTSRPTRDLKQWQPVAVRAVVFDIGGVLEVTPMTGWRDRWAERLGLTWPAIAERCADVFDGGSIGRLTLAEVEQQTARVLDLSETETASFMQDFWEEYLGTLNNELADYFSALRPRYRTAIVSNSFVGAREREHEAYKMKSLCDVLVYSHEVGVLKPEARIYEIALEQLGVRPSEAVFVDDGQMAVEGARALGMSAILFENNHQVIGALENCLGAR